MAFKKRAKVSAEFSMASLTDIIFLLLIFFMLTSSLVAPNALNLKLPGSSRTNVLNTNRTDDVRIAGNGAYYFNGRRISIDQLDGELGSRASGRPPNDYTITISPDRGAPVEYVVAIMDIALRYHINGILATEDE